ncbi:hypothetical protein [uncultured Psychroserpens sp.]|uniref:hypothetical protein n=1 Tax=uncultured Psychroserpens sp. TaxID=255436 RepID=UPI00261954D8|nr:hypothetical protein [uncultured Psychroserpens sp.]
MIKKLHSSSLTITLLLCFFNTGLTWSQSASNCINDYSAQVNKLESESSAIDDIEIILDFSQSEHKESVSLKIEIQPLNECWKQLEGSDRSESITQSINELNNYQGKLRLKFDTYNTKCFKWRAIIKNTDNGCETSSEWAFSSFL